MWLALSAFRSLLKHNPISEAYLDCPTYDRNISPSLQLLPSCSRSSFPALFFYTTLNTVWGVCVCMCVCVCVCVCVCKISSLKTGSSVCFAHCCPLQAYGRLWHVVRATVNTVESTHDWKQLASEPYYFRISPLHNQCYSNNSKSTRHNQRRPNTTRGHCSWKNTGRGIQDPQPCHHLTLWPEAKP